MDNQLFSKFAPILRCLTDAELTSEVQRPNRLLIASGAYAGKKLEVAYAPFDHVNHKAKIVIVGLTPGRQQMRNAVAEARRMLRNGASEPEALSAAKVFASFSGPMRANLIAMLDRVGANRALGIASTGSLWRGDADRVHFTSALRYPVFVDGANFSGAPSMLSIPLLREHLMQWFASEASALPEALFVPLGPKVAAAVDAVAHRVGISADRILSGLPHPSGANAERIAFFLDRKPREALSNRVEPERLIAARSLLKAKISGLYGS